MKQLIPLIAAVLMGLNGHAQEAETEYDLRFGVGSSFLGTGDMRTMMFENELNIKLNKYFTLGEGVGFAKSTYGAFEQAAFIQLNSNIYISPFRNNGKNDFRIGTGLSWYSVSDVYQSSATYQNGQLVDSEYEFDKRSSIGFNIMVENTYAVTDKFLTGLKLFTQLYQNSDINSGLLLKVGVKI